MNIITQHKPGSTVLLMGNEAIARGVLEAGAKICAAYPGNPSSEIIETLAKVADEMGLHVEWSVNEKVALEVAAAASFGGVRGFCAMKQNGINVCSDFLASLNLTGCEGGLVLAVADDPGGHSSSNEEDSRYYAKITELPLLEPATFQEAKDMTRWAFELSETLGLPVILRSSTRISHARGNVRLDELKEYHAKPRFDTTRLWIPLPVVAKHKTLHEKINRAEKIFNESGFNIYRGPATPELLIITCGTGWMYSLEAISNLDVEDRVGILKLATTWPLPTSFLLKHIQQPELILFLEEPSPFLEENVKSLYAQNSIHLKQKRFFGKKSGDLQRVGELDSDKVVALIQSIFKIPSKHRPPEYVQKAHGAFIDLVPSRELCFCAGCPHRATYWAVKTALAIDGRDGVVLGDIGCYSLGKDSTGYEQMKTMHAMGSGAGLACGLSQLDRFGFDQPVLAVCGDSTFYHAVMPALANGHYNNSNFLLLILDNNATAMTGFQPHPGTGKTAVGNSAPILDIEAICRALGASVEIGDPFDIRNTIKSILRLIEENNRVKVLILRQQCALVRSRSKKKLFRMSIDPDLCLGDSCGCSRFCTRVFKCPGLVWDRKSGKANIDEAICSGCGVCADICPESAIRKETL